MQGLEETLTAAVRDGQTAVGGTGRRKARSVQYWRVWTNRPDHQRHNWIQVGPAFSPSTAIEYTEFMEKKSAEPLKEYGVFDGVKNANLGIDRTEVFNNGTRFNPLIRNGGIKEMPKSQWIELGWHRNPQLAAMAPEEYELDKFVDFICPVDGRAFITEHAMQKYMRAMFPEATSAGAIGSEVGKALAGSGSVEAGGTSLTNEQLLQILGAMQAQNAEMVADAIKTALNPQAEEVIEEPEASVPDMSELLVEPSEEE